MMGLGWFELIGLVVGLLLGSFLNVCIVRVPRGESVVRPRSRCVRCGHAVRWFDNVPVISWVVLRGRCRDCGERISLRYWAVELAVGVWFAKAAAHLWVCWNVSSISLGDINYTASQSFLCSLLATGIAILGWLLIGLIVIDWEWQRLPDAFTLSGIGIGMFLVCLQAVFLGPTDDQVVLSTTKQLRMSSPGSFAAHGNVFLTGPEALIFGRLAAVCGAALILLLIRWGYKALRGREGLGLGDVKMLAMVAAFLGFWPAVLTLFVGVMLGSVYGVWMMVRGRAGGMTRLPLGSFLGVGGLVAALAGDRVIGWYSGLLR
jgi:leader peptidase (prepilin peptidase)/N-methyltransferase